MIKRIGMILLCMALFIFAPVALASENEEGFVDPTRSPDAPDYDLLYPNELVAEQIVARAFILMERSTGQVLMARNEDLVLFPASTTKIMTALMALQVGNLEDTLTISERAVAIPEDSSRVPFKAHEIVTLKDALYGLMLKSGNEAANAIAEYVAGDIDLFVTQMNETAAILGCENTTFVNPHGYHNEWHQTTAKDLATIMDAALENETFREIIRSSTYDLSATKENPARKIYNTNLHLDPESNYYYPASIGGKTGFTSEAGYVLVEAAEQDGIELIAVAMYSGKYSRWPDISRLFSYGFSQYKSVTPEDIYKKQPVELQINGFALDDPEIGMLELELQETAETQEVRFTGPKAEIDAIIENAADYTSYQYNIEMRAPIYQGQVVGTVAFYPPNNAEPAIYNLVASRSIAVRTDAPPTLEEIEARVLADPSPFPPFSWDWVLPPALVALAIVLGLYYGIRALVRRRKKKRPIPKPKKRTFN